MRFWPRKPGDDIARRLRAERPEPRGELLRAIEEGLETSERPARRFRPTRTAYALGLTTAMMGLLASFGGLSYAATSVGDGATRAAKIVKVTIGLKAAKPAKPSASARNSSADRNGGKVTICHVPPGNPGNAHTLTLSESGARNHLRNHSLDYEGACRPEPPECDDDDPDDDQYCEDDDDDDDDDDDRNKKKKKK